MIERAGGEAGLGFKAHPHMLRHACGYALANKGHDTRALQAYLGGAMSSRGVCYRLERRFLDDIFFLTATFLALELFFAIFAAVAFLFFTGAFRLRADFD